MGSRDVPYDPNAVCDCCGEKGAYDFMGDLLCGKCTEGITEWAPAMLDSVGKEAK